MIKDAFKKEPRAIFDHKYNHSIIRKIFLILHDVKYNKTQPGLTMGLSNTLYIM